MITASDVRALPSRRELLRRAGAGFGSLALAALLAEETAADGPTAHPLAPKLPHGLARARRVIFLFMPGGPSQVDTFDPKPRLSLDHGKPAPKAYLGETRKLLASPWKFRNCGESGLEVSELFPHVGACVDRLCVIRSMVGDDVNHPGGCLLMNTGERVATPAQPGCLGHLRPGHREPELAGLHCRRPGPLDRGRTAVRRCLPAGRLPGNVCVRPAQPDQEPQERPGGSRSASARSLTCCAGSTRCTARTARTIPG